MPLVGFYCSMECYGMQERLLAELSENEAIGCDVKSDRREDFFRGDDKSENLWDDKGDGSVCHLLPKVTNRTVPFVI